MSRGFLDQAVGTDEVEGAVNLLPTDPKALVDLRLYIEKNSLTLPQEVVGLALEPIHTVRLSLREIASYGEGK